MNAADLTSALGGRMHGRAGTACCPAHPDKNPSLSVSHGDNGRPLVHCHAGCEQRAVIAALQALGLWPGRTNEARAQSAVEQEELRKRRETRERSAERRAAFIARTWSATWDTALPHRGSPIEGWLRARGIALSAADFDRLPLRWADRCPLRKGTAPAIVALMTDPVTAEPSGVHRTFLLPDGSAKAFGKDSRMMLGRAGIIRLSPDDEVTEGLGICEGIETGLAIMAAGWRPIWAAGSIAAVRSFPVLGGIECLTIFADPKPHEVDGARACARRWSEAGREAIVHIPSGSGDWNDVLKGKIA